MEKRILLPINGIAVMELVEMSTGIMPRNRFGWGRAALYQPFTSRPSYLKVTQLLFKTQGASRATSLR